MQKILSFLRLALVSACLISGLACGFLNRGVGNTSNISVNNPIPNANVPANNPTTTVNKRDPKRVCEYLPDFTPCEYKSYGSYTACLNTNAGQLASGRYQNYSYGAYGDADNIERVSLTMLTNSKYQDAGEGDEYIA